MINHLMAALLLSAAPSPPVLEHRVAVPHPSGVVEARYRGEMMVSQRQTGTVGAPGRPSTLRCQWTVSLAVERQANHATGSAVIRSLRRDGVAKGSRAGWCETSRAAIDQDIAARAGEWQQHILALAEEDREELIAEVDRLHAERRG